MPRRRSGRVERESVISHRRLIVALLVMFLLVGCGYGAPPNSTRFHIWCYQYGKLIVSRIVIKAWHGLDYYWKDEQTGGKVLFPSRESGASCAWLGFADGG